ncbi:hypothetical protein BG003_007941, partial [Podila horticola]
MKINTCLLLSAAAAIAFAHQPTKTKVDHTRDLYTRNRFAEKRALPIIGDLLGGLDGVAQSTDEPSDEFLKRGLPIVGDLLEGVGLKKRKLPIVGDLLGGLDGVAQSTDGPSDEFLK